MRADTEDALRCAAQALVAEGCARVYVTLGADGCVYADDEGRFLRMQLRPAQSMLNATGAGDAFTAAAVYGYVKRFAPERTVSLALAAGLAAILSPTTVEPRISEAFLEGILRENPPVLC